MQNEEKEEKGGRGSKMCLLIPITMFRRGSLRATSALPQFELYLVPFLINSMSSLSKAKQQMDSQEAGL